MAKKKSSGDNTPQGNGDTFNHFSKVIKDSLNKSKRGIDTGQQVAFLLDDGECPVHVNDWIPTGNDVLDLAISNRANGGLPLGKIVEIFGLEGSGKSLLASHILKTTQEKGGVSVFIDVERAVSPEFLRAVGIDTKNLIYIPEGFLDRILTIIEQIVLKVKERNSDKIVTIVVDSSTATRVSGIEDDNFELGGYNTHKARLLSQYMPRITHLAADRKILIVFISQVRENLGAMPGQDKFVPSSGGKAIGFYSSVRLYMKKKGKIRLKSEVNDVVGEECLVEVHKNRVGPPKRKVEFNMYYHSGIDNYGSWFKTCKDFGIIKQSGAWYTIPIQFVEEETGEVKDEIKFQQKQFKEIIESNPDLREKLYEAMCSAYIMRYQYEDVLTDEEIVYESEASHNSIEDLDNEKVGAVEEDD